VPIFSSRTTLILTGLMHEEEMAVTTRTAPVPTDPVKIIMADRLADIGPEQSLRSIARGLVANEIGVLVVRTSGGPVGLISERDIVTVLATGGDLDKQQAVDVMTSDLVTAKPTDSIASVGRLMLDAGVRHIVIREDTVVGLVSIRDVLAVLLGHNRG
jgi:CBS domain-containing protein